jgi:dTMP kinase
MSLAPNLYRGKLIIVEGIDGSGKSTQLSLLSQWLRSQGLAVAFSSWNSSPLVKETTRRGKKKEMFTPTTFSLIHATDFADRLDVARGVTRTWVRNLYRIAIEPSLAFYFRVPLEVAIGRILGGRNAIKYYEAGMDIGLSRNVVESFRLFQGRILEEYDAMAEEMGFHIIDATQSIEQQQQIMREITLRELGESLRTRILRAPGGSIGKGSDA